MENHVLLNIKSAFPDIEHGLIDELFQEYENDIHALLEILLNLNDDKCDSEEKCDNEENGDSDEKEDMVTINFNDGDGFITEDITPPQPSMGRRVSNLLNYIIGKEEKKDNDKYIELHQHDESN